MASALAMDLLLRHKAVARTGFGTKALVHRDIFDFIRREPRRE